MQFLEKNEKFKKRFEPYLILDTKTCEQKIYQPRVPSYQSATNKSSTKDESTEALSVNCARKEALVTVILQGVLSKRTTHWIPSQMRIWWLGKSNSGRGTPASPMLLCMPIIRVMSKKHARLERAPWLNSGSVQESSNKKSSHVNIGAWTDRSQHRTSPELHTQC